MLKISVGDPGVQDISDVEPILRSLPEVEQKFAMLLVYNLVMLKNHAYEFSAGVAMLKLIDYYDNDVTKNVAKESIKYTQCTLTSNMWRNIAMRDAGMTVFHFGKTVEGLRSNVVKISSWNSEIDYSKLRDAWRYFLKEFPNFELMRNFIGHRAEMSSSIESIKRHAVGGEFVLGSIKGSTYSVTSRGVRCMISLDNQTYLKLISIVNKVYESFPPLVKHFEPIEVG